MNWTEAQARIMTLHSQTNLNTARSNYRSLREVSHDGVVVSIGKKAQLMLPWALLEECFNSLLCPTGYSGKWFREHYPQLAQNHPCHVHVIGRLFVVAGIATKDNTGYRMI